MKALPFLLFWSLPVLANTVVSLPGRKTNFGSSGDLPVLYDLTAELQKKKISPDPAKEKLLQVEVVAKAGPTGAIYALMMNGVAVDSATVTDDRETTLRLVSDSEQTPAPWVLGIRGDVDLREIRVSFGARGSNPVPAEPRQEAPPLPENPPPAAETPPERSDEDLLGRRVIVVSRTSGRIDYVVVQKRDADGTYTVLFQGLPYEGFERRQIALLEGCWGDLCVGDRFEEGRDRGRILGRLPDHEFVIERADGERRVVSARPSSRPPVQKENPSPKQESPPKRAAEGLKAGRIVLYVLKDDSVVESQITKISGRELWLRPREGGREIRTSDPKSIGILSGCLGDFCVGDSVIAKDSEGADYEAEILAFQARSHAVIRIRDGGWEIGNWPLRALRHR